MTLNSHSLPIFSSQNYKLSRPEVFISSPRTLNLNPDDFMPKKSKGVKTSNAFLIYRTIYSKTLTQKGYPSKMTEVSRWASESWNRESEELKNEYKEFAKKVSQIYHKNAELLVPRILPTILPIQPPELYQNNAIPDLQWQNHMAFIQQQQMEQFQLFPNFQPLYFEPHYSVNPQFRPSEDIRMGVSYVYDPSLMPNYDDKSMDDTNNLY
ncbi:hypothetical protein RclHR1_00110029 [Rhizophagus clarus]|uniref:HMG box domain-containing protein n=1 Tax=Rhizophagus clarus TaxID=94130 RepID=A0A2Z6QVY7_9GLOM|nr:hypothetical protein RclHR1_00110029 [Rhizophagus clarus]GES97989.1 hypothetical protein GLOIN_2v1522850 [Rhizophagus clarus]